MLHRADKSTLGVTPLQVVVLGALLTWNGMVSKQSSTYSFVQMFLPVALAEQGGCPSCGGGGSDGEGGGQAGEILLGIAAILAPIMAAVAQISAAETQAEADKFVAKTAADAAITQTKIQANVTKQLSDNQRSLSEQNLAVTQQLAREQEDARRERVNLQLAALEKERAAQEAERREIRAIEQDRIDQQIAFAKEQADENLRLAKLSINTQLVAQGLATGVAPAGSRGRLTTTSTGTSSSTGTLASSITQRAVSSPASQSRGATVPASSRAGSTIVSRGVASIPGSGSSQLASLTGSSKLIQAVQKDALAGVKNAGVGGTGAVSGAPGVRNASGFQFAPTGGDFAGSVPSPQLDQQIQSAGVVRGSTRGVHQLTDAAKAERDGNGSDLTRFLSTVRSDAVWRGTRHTSGGNAAGSLGGGHQNRGIGR
ncbi:MAG: hypothetical protein KDD51_13780 [Bdellovibrionales bacterium]|nr:hypothetical protein [Bdellovibrionales bacterium]